MDDVTSALADLKLDQIPVYLLKTISAPSDGYEAHFTSLDNGNFKPIFVPVLEHLFRDDALRKLRLSAERFAFASGSPATARQKATHNPAKRYGALIFTSQRAVDAFTIMVAKLDPAKKEMLFDPRMPIYVVGPATAKGVKAMDLPCPILGEETGNGDAAMDLDSEDQLLDAIAAKKRQLQTEAEAQEKEQKSEDFPDTNTCVTIDMLVTVASEFYGQKDLLVGRLAWDHPTD